MSAQGSKYNSSSLIKTVIKKVKDQPEIWQSRHPMYHKKFVHKNFWSELSSELGVKDIVLRKRWKYAKDQYRKELKSAIENGTEDSVTWQYFKSLSFYREEVLNRDRERAVAAAVDTDESRSNSEDEAPAVERNSQSQTLNRARKIEKKSDDSMKLNVILKRLTQTKNLLEKKLKDIERRNDDTDYMFLMSLLPCMKQLSEVQKLQIKGKINNWLLEALETKTVQKEYVNAYDPVDDDDSYVPTNMEIIKCESESE